MRGRRGRAATAAIAVGAAVLAVACGDDGRGTRPVVEARTAPATPAVEPVAQPRGEDGRRPPRARRTARGGPRARAARPGRAVTPAAEAARALASGGTPAPTAPLPRPAAGIAFVRIAPGVGKPRIHVVEPGGGRPVAFPVGVDAADGPAWSPDGRRLAFVGGTGDPSVPHVAAGADLYVAAADGAGRRRLTRTAEAEAAPSWSPDGRRLVAVRTAGDDEQRLVAVPARGGRARTITRGATDVSPSWGPDGRIAFLRIDPRTLVGRLHTVRPDGTGLRALLPGLDGASAPAWSPDGRRLVVAQRDAVVVVGADGRGRRAVARLRAGSTGARVQPQPAWSPDGRSIVFAQADPASASRTELWLVPAGGGEPRRLLRAPHQDLDPSWGP